MNSRIIVRHQHREGERGAATLKFLVVAAVIGLAAYAAYLYIPVAYNASVFKDAMQESVDKAAILAVADKSEMVKKQLRTSAKDYDLPEDTTIQVVQEGSNVRARVQFTKAINFPGYTYEYNFDHTARSTGMFNVK